MRQMAEHAEVCGVTLAVEYLNRFECYLLNSAADTVRFVKAVDHPHCRMMYDTFHANIEEKNPAQAIRHAAEYTVHVHISENDRSTPGAGNVPLGRHVRHAGRDRLRRLADDRGLWPGAARAGGGHEDLAAHVHHGRAACRRWPGFHEASMVQACQQGVIDGVGSRC